MNTTHTRTTSLAGAIAAVAAPALLFLSVGTAQAARDVSEAAPGITIGAFDPQPDPPGIGDPGLNPSPGLNPPPGLRVRIGDPGIKVALGGPDTSPAH